MGPIAKKFTFIRQGLAKPMKAKLTRLLIKNSDFFAWAPKDMPGIDLRVICHRLAIDLKV